MSAPALSLVLIIAAHLVEPSLAGGSRRRSPPPSPTPSPSPPLPQKPICTLAAKCQQGLNTTRPCTQTRLSGGAECWRGLKVWQKDLTQRFGCPDFFDPNKPTLGGVAFCWCGLDDVETLESVSTVNTSLDSHISERNANRLTATVTGGSCHNRKDGGALKKRGKNRMADIMKDCANKAADVKPALQGAKQHQYLTSCISGEVHPPGSKYAISTGCASCFAGSVECAEANCIEECACVSWTDQHCNACMNAHCKGPFDKCSGLKSAAATHANEGDFLASVLNASGAEDPIGSDYDVFVV